MLKNQKGISLIILVLIILLVIVIGTVSIVLIMNNNSESNNGTPNLNSNKNNASLNNPVVDNNRDKSTTNENITINTVKNAKETDSSKFEYEEVEGGISITDYNGNDEIVVIPETINGKTVISIGKNAFVNNNTIRGLKLADTVHTIGSSAFMNCFELEVFVSGASLKKLDSYSFNCCTKLRDVELNNGLESMLDCFGFANISKIYIPSTVTEMFVPFCVPTSDYYITIIGEPGSYVEQYVNENGEEYHLIFQAK